MAKISPHPSLHGGAAPARQNERLIVTDMEGDSLWMWKTYSVCARFLTSSQNHKLLLGNKHYIFTDILYQPFNPLLRSLKLILHEMLPKVLG